MEMITTPLVFIDLETTGLNPENEKIIQIAAIKVDQYKEETFATYVNPEKPINEFIQNLTGINDETVKDSPTEKEALEMLSGFIPHNAIIVAQNAPFDLSFLYYAGLRAGFISNHPDFYCTRTMAAVLFPALSHRLVDIVKLFDIKLEQAHDALNDVTATKDLFFRLKDIADLHNINFVNKLIEHPDRPTNFKPDNAVYIIGKKK